MYESKGKQVELLHSCHLDKFRVWLDLNQSGADSIITPPGIKGYLTAYIVTMSGSRFNRISLEIGFYLYQFPTWSSFRRWTEQQFGISPHKDIRVFIIRNSTENVRKVNCIELEADFKLHIQKSARSGTLNCSVDIAGYCFTIE